MRSLMLFQKDLRLDDNPALMHAVESSEEILLLCVIDEVLWRLQGKVPNSHLAIEKLASIQLLKEALESEGYSLMVCTGDTLGIISKLHENHHFDAIWINEVKEPGYIKIKEKLSLYAANMNIQLKVHATDQPIAQDVLLNKSNKPYQVFTAFYRHWLTLLEQDPGHLHKSLGTFSPENKPSCLNLNDEEFGGKHFKEYDLQEVRLRTIELKTLPERERLKLFLDDALAGYASLRDYPAVDGCSGLSAGINTGRISFCRIIAESKSLPNSQPFIRQLAWRCFFQHLLLAFPEVEHTSFREAYRNIEWDNDLVLYDKWKNGETGFPLIDAGMKELKNTGVMHNRIRMLSASFLVKNLLIDWRWGESYFYEMLRDGDLASNNGSWQWCASTGSDAQPYFRTFNPNKQLATYDAELLYTNKWVELSAYNEGRILPCIDLKQSIQRAKSKYKLSKERMEDAGYNGKGL